MRFLAVDLGDKRTGVAIGDDELFLAQPVCVIQVDIGKRLIDELVVTTRDQDAQALVFGLPLNMDGTLGHRATITKEFATQVQIATGLPLHFQDERLTSAAAEEHLSGSGKTHKQKKNIRDALAAAEILNDFLQSKREDLNT